MTNFIKILVIIFFLNFLLSCGGGGQTNNNAPVKNEVPKALQNDNLKIRSSGRSSDLIEELYRELVDKIPALKKLDEDLGTFSPKSSDLKEKFNQYDSKSNSYYSSANYKVSTISDSLLRIKVISLITKSMNQYAGKTAELSSLLKQITKNGSTLKDHYSVLKIVLTLPLIEKYQSDNKPNKKEYKDLINEQENLILSIDSSTSKY